MRLFALLLIATGLWACQPAEQPTGGVALSPEPMTSEELVRAEEGEAVVMFFTYVKADKRAQFEEFVDFMNTTVDQIAAEDP